MFDLRGLFSTETIKGYFRSVPELKTPVMDLVFPERPQNPFPLVGVDDVLAVAHEVPLIKRGHPSIPATRETGGINTYEPLSVRIHSQVLASDLNNLKLVGRGSQELWAQNKFDLLRRSYRKTSEAICAQALSGRIEWPVRIEGGAFDTYTVDYGQVLSVESERLWDAADVRLVHIVKTLLDMKKALQVHGYGSTLEIWAGDSAFEALFILAENHISTAKIRVEVTADGINVCGFLVKQRAETYRDPATGQIRPIVAENSLRMIATDAGHKLVYCAVDDLDANLQPLPLFIKPVKIEDPSGWTLIAEGKPFPVVNVRGICDAQVLA